MKNLTKLLFLLLALTLVFSLFSCGGDKCKHVDADGDYICDKCDEELEKPEEPETKLSLVTDGTVNFQVVYAKSMSTDARQAVNDSIIKPLKKQNLTVKFVTEGSKDDVVQDCEILIGDITTRDEKYRTKGHHYGKDGYVIKLVDSKVIINAGSSSAIVDAIGIFAETVFAIDTEEPDFTNVVMSSTQNKEVVETDYKITAITVSGNNIKDYTIATDTKSSAYLSAAEDLQYMLYDRAGLWLEIVDLTAATDMPDKIGAYKYSFDKTIYDNRVFDSKGVADPDVEIKFGPNIKDWPAMVALPENMILKVVSEIHDPVTTTDELIPSGETSSYRSNPLGLAEFTLSRKDPEYVGRAKEIQKAQKALEAGENPTAALPEMESVYAAITKAYPEVSLENLGIGSTIFAVKPGDGSAREQAASCQKVLGGWANIANEYATKRYRSNLINWGMLPFVIEEGELPFKNLDYLFIPGIRKAVEEKASEVKAYVVSGSEMKEFKLTLGEMTDDEREIILKGCLINYNRVD